MAEAGGGIGSTSALQELDAELQNQVAQAVDGLGQRSDEAFARAAEQLEAIRTASTAIVDRLVEETDKANGLISQTEDTLRQRFTTLQAEHEKHSAGVSEAQARIAQGLGEVDQAVQLLESAGHSLEGGANERLQQFVSDVQNAIDALQQAMQASGQQVEQFRQALEMLGQNTENHVGEAEQALQALGERLTQLVDAARDALEQAAQQAQQQLEQDFTAAMNDLENIGGQALDAIEALMKNAGATGDKIGDDIREVLDFINKVVDLIEKIRPILELAEQLS